ncbi:amidohydrolase family protein, partial [Chloroflexota bacterium]
RPNHIKYNDMIIDFHTHIFPPDINKNRDNYLGLDPSFDMLYANPKAKIASAEDIIESMDRDGIDISVVINIGWISTELCHRTNDYIMESISRYPKRLIGFCAVQPLLADEAVAEIERCVRGGVRGIGELRSDTQGFDLGDKNVMEPIVQTAKEHNLIILSHSSEPVGHTYPGKGAITPDVLYRFVTSFPDLPLVLAHWGGGLPFYALMPEVKKSLSSVYFDTAASPFLYGDSIFKHVIEILGAGNILFGSDYPLIKQDRIVNSINALDLPEEARRLILGGNAQKILFPD